MTHGGISGLGLGPEMGSKGRDKGASEFVLRFRFKGFRFWGAELKGRSLGGLARVLLPRSSDVVRHREQLELGV